MNYTLVRWLISQANEQGECTLPYNDIYADYYGGNLIIELKDIENNMDWEFTYGTLFIGDRQTSIVHYKVNRDGVLRHIVRMINDYIAENHAQPSLAGEMDNNDIWAELIRKGDMQRVFSLLRYSESIGDFDWADSYFFYDSEGELFFSFSSLEDLEAHDITFWRECDD